MFWCFSGASFLTVQFSWAFCLWKGGSRASEHQPGRAPSSCLFGHLPKVVSEKLGYIIHKLIPLPHPIFYYPVTKGTQGSADEFWHDYFKKIIFSIESITMFPSPPHCLLHTPQHDYFYLKMIFLWCKGLFRIIKETANFAQVWSICGVVLWLSY